MKNNRLLLISIIWIVIGGILVPLSLFGILDSFWSGMGAALIVVGTLQLIRKLKYVHNDEYRTKVDIENQDERNRFLSMKAWSWAGYLFVLITAIGTIVFKILGWEDIMMYCSGSLCLLLIIYWISYCILRKKY